MWKVSAGLQVREAGDSPVEEDQVLPPEGVAESLHLIQGLGAEVHQGIVKGEAVFLGESVEPRHVLAEGDGEEGLGHGGEEVEQLPPGPGGAVDDLRHGEILLSCLGTVYQTGRKLQGPFCSRKRIESGEGLCYTLL